MSRIIRLAAVTLAITLMTGCIVVGGRQTVQKPTRGQELIDHKAAHEAGAMSDAEYNCQRNEILKN